MSNEQAPGPLRRSTDSPDHEARMRNIEDMLGQMHKRVFNGLAFELRKERAEDLAKLADGITALVNKATEETRKEVSAVRSLVVGILISVTLLLGGSVITGVVELASIARQTAHDSTVIDQVQKSLDKHMGSAQGVTP